MSKPNRKLGGMVQSELADVSPGFQPRGAKPTMLEEVDLAVDWDAVRKPLLAMYADCGRPALDPVLLVKMTLLKLWFRLSDPQCESQCNDRLSFRRFLGLGGIEAAPDETSLVRFRARLEAHGLGAFPVDEVHWQLERKGLIVRTGLSVIVDGSLVRSQTNRGSSDAEGNPIEPEAQTQGRSDGKPPVHGYKMHMALDADSGVILGVTATAATGCERSQLEHLVLEGDAELNADKGYASKDVDAMLEAKKVRNRVMRKKPRGGELSEADRRRNQSIQAKRGRIEGVFGVLKNVMGMARAPYRGLKKVSRWFGWLAMAFNLKRLSKLGRLQTTEALAGAGSRAGP